MMTMVMLGRLWCGGDDGSGYDIVGMVVMRCDEDGGGGCGFTSRFSGAWDGDGGSGVMMVVELWWAAVGRQLEEVEARRGE
ncbi:hypothetical protein Tco_0359330 [Tanacetum coccineum]